MALKASLTLLAAACGLGMASQAAWAEDPIKIGVIAETSAISGVAVPNGAKLAADEINAAGGVNGRKVEIVEYDDHNSAADAVRAFQRAAQQDKVNAVIASYISEVVLALEPWAGRLHMPMITPGAASNDITKRVHDDYDHMKYVFARLPGLHPDRRRRLRERQGPADQPDEGEDRRRGQRRRRVDHSAR